MQLDKECYMIVVKTASKLEVLHFRLFTQIPNLFVFLFSKLSASPVFLMT